MNWVASLALVAIVVSFLIEGFIRPARLYQFPFLAGTMTFAFIVPQMPGVANDSFLPEGSYVKVCVMGILCLLLLRAGWSGRIRPIAVFNQSFSEARMLLAAAVLSAIGAVFYVKLSHLPGELTIGVQMSGAPVMYLFFARFLTYGMTISTLCFARRPNAAAAAIMLMDISLYLDRVLITGKRAEAVELILIILLSVWFQKRWIVPRFFVFVAILAGTVGMASMSDYRQITRKDASFDWEQIKKIDVGANFEQLWQAGGPELRNAADRIDHIDRTLEFDYGKVHWNHLVFNFVPAQIFGDRFKNSLMLSTPGPGRDYQPLTGTTKTGMVDAFQSFWYFGALKFLLLSWMLSRLWGSAMAGQTPGQIAYILSIVPAMHAVSHETDWVVQVWVHMVFFLAPALLFAAIRTRKPRFDSLDPAAIVHHKNSYSPV